MSVRTQALSPELDSALRALISSSSADLAAAVLKLSDFYLSHSGAHTPWDEPGAAAAYLAYFQPLNFARLRDVFREVERFLPSDSFKEIWDFGSGLGTTQWVLENMPSLPPRPLNLIERSPLALQHYTKLRDHFPTRWSTDTRPRASVGPAALAVFSYSFLEMQSQLPNFDKFDHILIVEPSTRERSRELMAWRTRFFEQGFQTLAPCTHNESCPLLTQSSRDWCHMRVQFSPPEWWHELEEQLPMKNRTLTYSYLLVSRTVHDLSWRGSARVIGDTLVENGKSRQMICRGPNREFLSWLHKQGPVPEIPSGALIRGVDQAEVRGGGHELRPAPGSLDWSEGR